MHYKYTVYDKTKIYFLTVQCWEKHEQKVLPSLKSHPDFLDFRILDESLPITSIYSNHGGYHFKMLYSAMSVLATNLPWLVRSRKSSLLVLYCISQNWCNSQRIIQISSPHSVPNSHFSSDPEFKPHLTKGELSFAQVEHASWRWPEMQGVSEVAYIIHNQYHLFPITLFHIKKCLQYQHDNFCDVANPWPQFEPLGVVAM